MTEERANKMKKMIKLPDSELEIMQAIWLLNQQGEPNVTAGLITRRFPEVARLKLTTVLTLITRLDKKGFIRSEKVGRTNCYTPLVKREDYLEFAADDFLRRTFLGDRENLIRVIRAGK